MAGERGQVRDWVGLRLIPGVGSVRFHHLLQAFGDPGSALGAPVERLRRIKGVGQDLAGAIHRREYSRDPDEELAGLEELGARVVTLDSPDYPPLLAQVFAPPPVLFVLGDLAGCAGGGVAVVGTRKVTPYARRVAADLGAAAGRAGVSLVSGLARGVDTAAHQACLAAGGHTVGVLGCGLDVSYPPENRGLAREMARRGAVVSEFPLGSEPRAGNFPVRNRIISGLSRAVVVVAAGLRSGALITARHALDQGREIFAVPGPVGDPVSAGCFELIRQGARLYTEPGDVLGPGALPPAAAPSAEGPAAPAELPPEAARLWDLIGEAPVHLDALVRESGLGPQEVSALLVNLELAGLIEARPGKNYVRAG